MTVMRDFDPAARHPQGERGEPGPAAGTGEPWSRRVFLRTAAGGTAGMAAWSLLSARGSAASAASPASAAGRGPAGLANPGSPLAGGGNGPTAKVTSFDAGWLFGPSADGSDQPGF